MAWMPSGYFQKNCGKFEIIGSYGGYPHWHGIKCGKHSIEGLKIDDIKDLKYLLERAIEHHDAHGDKS